MSTAANSPTFSEDQHATFERLANTVKHAPDFMSDEQFYADIRTALTALDDMTEAHDDTKRLAREMDVSMFGEQGAAKAPSLCDIAGSVRDMARDNRSLRLMLYVAHSNMRGYHDDGELQDTSQHPHIDWKRDSLTTLRRKVTERGLRRYEAELEAARLSSP